jgi:hypothetical protein
MDFIKKATDSMGGSSSGNAKSNNKDGQDYLDKGKLSSTLSYKPLPLRFLASFSTLDHGSAA